MRIIVTGSAGFIGQNLVRYLRDMGCEVFGIDRRDGTEASDLSCYLYGNGFGAEPVDCVVHLAAQTSVWNDDRPGIIADNVAAFERVASACQKYGIPMVYASSSCANEANVTSLYGLTKNFAERCAALYCPRAIGLRFHNVYAMDSRPGTLPSILARKEYTSVEEGLGKCLNHV